MSEQVILPEPLSLDIIVKVSGDEVWAELDVRNNPDVRIGDQYTVSWDDGALSILRITKFQSAEDYTPTIARRAEAMREGVASVPATLTARKAYQTKLAVLKVEGELLANGKKRIGASRSPDVMVPISRISENTLEQFVTTPDGNLILGNLRSGRRILNRVARIRVNYSGERMVIFGRPGMGKTQLTRSLLSQAMSEVETNDDLSIGGPND